MYPSLATEVVNAAAPSIIFTSLSSSVSDPSAHSNSVVVVVEVVVLVLVNDVSPIALVDEAIVEEDSTALVVTSMIEIVVVGVK